MPAHPQNPLRSIDDLVEYYHSMNHEQNLYVGIEWERSGVYREDLSPVRYTGENGYLAILKKLVEEVGWEIISSDKDNIYELQRGETRITIEGDGRLELAGSPQENLHDLARELRLHNNEVVEMGNIFNIGWLPLGVQPLHSNEDIPLLPKERYQIFRGVGDEELMATMTKRNNGVTANLSFVDEENAIIKAQTAFRILPIVGAMFASSPLDRGQLSPYLDLRRYTIQNHAPDRTGIPKDILSESFSLRDWLQFYLDTPMVLMSINGKEQRLEHPITFAEWIEKGYEGTFPTVEDFDQFVKTTWSDLRLRPSYLEYRVADSVPFSLIMALPALMKGLLFDSSNWEAVAELTKDWTYEDIIDADRRAWKTGLRTEVKGRSLLLYAQELIALANEKLHHFQRTDSADNDETIYLTTLKQQIYIQELSPAEEIVSCMENEWSADARRVLEWCEQK